MTRETEGVFFPFEEMEPAQDILEQIMEAGDIQIHEFVNAIIRRYQVLYPEWEVVFLALPTDPAKRGDAIENMIRLLRSCCGQPEP